VRRRYYSLKTGKSGYVPLCRNEWEPGLCDECRHVAAFTFEKILRAAKARYVYGLSATPVRQDGHQPIIFMQCGPVHYRVDAKSQADKRSFDHYAIPRFIRTRLPAVRKIQDAYAGIVNNDARNGLIISDAAGLPREGRTPLLLTERREHAERLAGRLRGMAEHIFLLVGTGSQKEKREKLSALREAPPGESLVVTATGKYVGEGFDEPRLDTILLSMPISWKGTLAQYAGRLHRSCAGKQERLCGSPRPGLRADVSQAAQGLCRSGVSGEAGRRGRELQPDLRRAELPGALCPGPA